MRLAPARGLLTCPCLAPGSAKPLESCCGRYHAGALRLMAPTATLLMRSRYSAFVLDRTDYLLETWHASTRPGEVPANLPGLRWLGLEVRRSAEIDAEHSTVEYVARSKLGGRAQRLHELARFVREGGHWFYIDGQILGTPASNVP